MLFTKLKLNYFGRFCNKEIELKPGINLIYGDNEAGKSTIHAFIRGMLFGIERLRGRGSASREDVYTKYLPWDYPGAYSGSMDLKLGDKEYRLQRSFHANDKNFTVLELSTGREVKFREDFIGELIPGLTESTYKNTISIEQLKSQTEASLAAEVRNYIANLSITKSKEIDVAKATSSLTRQRKQLEASQVTDVLSSLQADIQEGLEKEIKIDQLTLQLKEMLKQEAEIIKQKETLQNSADIETTIQMEQFPAIMEKYKQYTELIQQENILKLQCKELQDKVTASQNHQLTLNGLREDMGRISKLQGKHLEDERLLLELKEKLSRLNNNTRRNVFVSILPGILFALLSGVMTEFKTIGVLFAILFASSGVVGFITLNRKNSKLQESLQKEYNRTTQDITAIRTEMEGLLHKYGVTHIEGLAGKQEEAFRDSYTLENIRKQLKESTERRKDLEDKVDILYDSIMKYIQYFMSEDELTDQTMQKLQRTITDRKQDTLGKLLQVNRLQESLKLTIEKLRWELKALEGNETELLKNKERYQELEQKQKETVVELDAIKLALNTIEELSAEIHDSFGQQLNLSVSESIGKVTDQKYTDIKIDEKLEIKVGWNRDYVPLDRLSAGTIDQVYFALRLAVGNLLLGGEEVPILLDDSFAYYDEKRVREVLLMLSQRKQVILFTCHSREQMLLKDMKVPYHYVDLS